jgi:hypothetical protein
MGSATFFETHASPIFSRRDFGRSFKARKTLGKIVSTFGGLVCVRTYLIMCANVSSVNAPSRRKMCE